MPVALLRHVQSRGMASEHPTQRTGEGMIAMEFGYTPIDHERRAHNRRHVHNWTTQGASLLTDGNVQRVAMLHAQVEDLSLDGMRIACDGTLAPGSQYWFRIESPGGCASFRVRGQVAWIRRSDVAGSGTLAGIYFLPLSEERTIELQRALEIPVLPSLP